MLLGQTRFKAFKFKKKLHSKVVYVFLLYYRTVVVLKLVFGDYKLTAFLFETKWVTQNQCINTN